MDPITDSSENNHHRCPRGASGPCSAGQSSRTWTTQKIRPTQTGEFLRQYVSCRLLAVCEGEIATLMTAMRRIGVGSQGEGATGKSPPTCRRRVDGKLEPLARIKVDEKKCFGKIEWSAARQVGSTAQCPWWNKKEQSQYLRTVARSKETWTA